CDPEPLEPPRHAGPARVGWDTTEAQPQSNVGGHGRVGEERLLEHRRHRPALCQRRRRGHDMAVNPHLASIRRLQESDDPQQRGLATAVGPDHREHLSRLDRELGHVEDEARCALESDAGERDDRRTRTACHAGRTWIDPRWMESCQCRSRWISRISYPGRGTSTSRSYSPCAGSPGSSSRIMSATVVPKSASATTRPDIKFMWCPGSGAPRSFRISRTYSGRMKKAIGASDDGRYAWVGEFTASIVRPRHRSWMRSGDALITVPCRMLRVRMSGATASD